VPTYYVDVTRVSSDECHICLVSYARKLERNTRSPAGARSSRLPVFVRRPANVNVVSNFLTHLQELRHESNYVSCTCGGQNSYFARKLCQYGVVNCTIR